MTAPLQTQLTVRILQHVRERRMERGEHLPEQVLADLFRVSRAPVHAALRALQEDGVVQLERNRGFFLRKGAGELTSGSGDLEETGETEDERYLAIAADRLAGRLPERISGNELMRRYRLTRVQAAKIMARVAQEGWAERLPGGGWGFLPILSSREAYDMSYRFRTAIEAAAVLEPTFRVDKESLAALRAEQRALLDGEALHLPRARLFQINSGFHETIIGWTGNPFFIEALRRVNRLRRLLEYRLSVDRSPFARQCREHLELLDLLEATEFATASAALRAHIDGARRVKTASLG